MNPYISTDEIEIDLLDLAKYLLRRFIWILLVGVLCAACAGAFAYIRGRKDQSAIPAGMESESKTESESETETEIKVEFDQERYNSELRAYEIESELLDTSNESIADLARKQDTYLTDSLYLKLNPYRVWRAYSVIQIESRDRDYPAYQIRELCRQKVYEGQYLNELAKKRGVKSVYLYELIGAWGVGSSTNTGGTATDVVIKEDGDERTTSELLLVQGLGRTKIEAQELLDAAMDALESYSRELRGEYPHKFQVLDSYCQLGTDNDIRNKQKDHETYTKAIMDQVKDNKEKAALLVKPKTEEELIEDAIEEKKAEEALAAESETEAFMVKEPESPKRHMMKFAIIGFIIGVIIMCLVFAVRYMRNDLLVSYKDLERKGFFLKDLGTVADAQGVVMAAASIRSFAGDGRKLFVTGLAQKEVFDRVCGELKQELPGYQLVCAADVLRSPEARKQLLDCDIVALIEQQGVTKYSELKEEVTYLYHTDREIVGIMIS